MSNRTRRYRGPALSSVAETESVHSTAASAVSPLTKCLSTPEQVGIMDISFMADKSHRTFSSAPSSTASTEAPTLPSFSVLLESLKKARVVEGEGQRRLHQTVQVDGVCASRNPWSSDEDTKPRRLVQIYYSRTVTSEEGPGRNAKFRRYRVDQQAYRREKKAARRLKALWRGKADEGTPGRSSARQDGRARPSTRLVWKPGAEVEEAIRRDYNAAGITHVDGKENAFLKFGGPTSP
ncbi:hypothetical protein Z517_05312 [Fonsecaea pedrosoi CBS 271.37]|uniref:Uncharacterized protein n=1 Tax=Fonsecaea pedrosoi CBS 271.37 TaxID=1442368 RepID=A0A0D2GUJ5_9EURO|nr:uncharacterized protein Z517_05312 [Fonsecaea pedrosoi CBS 271.37]KIW82285.1 hypothetical protein Z517_05312 [Fonsecaea pedrosoi CBS 271.37]